MKKLITIVALLTTVLLTEAQVVDSNTPPPAVSGPGWELVQFLSTGSNWMVAPYAIYAPSGGKNGNALFGGGVGFGYKINDFVVPTMRLDYLDSQLWMPSASLQLQAPLKLFNKVTWVPFAFAGIATPIAGKGSDNGTAVGIFGAGAAVKLDFLGKVGEHLDLIGDYEKWSGFNGNQIRFGVVYKF